jgi:hypothetical protein
MDPLLCKIIDANTPKFNRNIADGLATIHIPYALDRVDKIARSASQGFPKDLVYHGVERCTPTEEFHEVTRAKNNKKRSVDIARSDLYLCKYLFSYKGEKLPPKYFFLPYVSDGATIMMAGSRYAVSPVITDKVISPSINEVFVRLLRDKITFERLSYTIVINDRRETTQVVWSTIYHKPASMRKMKSNVKANCSIVHYLFCKYGLDHTFEKYAGFKPIIIAGNVDNTLYNSEKYTVFSSSYEASGGGPKGFGKGYYVGTNLKFVVPNELVTNMSKSLIAGFYYIIDHFQGNNNIEYFNEVMFWQVLFGKILFSHHYTDGKLISFVSKHISSLDEYLDKIVQEQLEDIGYKCENIYDLFAVVIDSFSNWLFNSGGKVSSMYDKELSILYNVLESINNAIFNLNFRLKTANTKELSKNEVINIINSVIKTRAIFSLTKSHLNMSSVSYSGDNKFLSVTNILVPQSTSGKSNGKKKKREPVSDPSKHLNASLAEVGGFINLPKSEPTGHSRINPYVKIDHKAVIVRDERKVELLNSIQAKIKR